MDGMLVAEEFLVELSIPVLLCSNNPFGRAKQLDLLTEYGVPVHDCDIANKAFYHTVNQLLSGGTDG